MWFPPEPRAIEKGSLYESLYPLTNLQTTNIYIYCYMKKTKIITNAYWIVDSTYTVSYLIGVRPVV